MTSVAVVDAFGTVVTHDRLTTRSLEIARLFASMGLAVGDRIALLLENRAEFLEVALAAQRSGLLYTPVNWHLTEREAAYIVDDCGARVLITSTALAGTGVAAAAAASGRPSVLTVDEPNADTQALGVVSLDEALRSRTVDGVEPAEVEGYYVFYSSGTTGQPKGIAVALESAPFGTGLPVDSFVRAVYGFGSDTIYYSPGPLYHAAPLGWSLATVRLGGTVVLGDRFDAADALGVLTRHRVTHAQLTPTMLVRMLRLDAAVRSAADLSALRVLVHSGAPCPPNVKRSTIEWLGPIVHEYYSGSEGIGLCAIDSEDWLAHPGSVGRAMLGELHVVDDDGHEVPPGHVGRVFFGATPRFEYTNSPDKTSAAYEAHGWATLGDLGHVDDDGYLYLADRRTDLIVSGGVNIYPREIEDVLIGHPAVADVAVIGVPDAEWGQALVAVVQPVHGTVRPPELLAYCRERLSGYKCPRLFVELPELPRLPSGKMLRRQLREQFSAGQ